MRSKYFSHTKTLPCLVTSLRTRHRAMEARVRKKFLDARKERVREALWPVKWNFGFVVSKTKHPEGLPFIEKHGIRIASLG